MGLGRRQVTVAGSQRAMRSVVRRSDFLVNAPEALVVRSLKELEDHLLSLQRLLKMDTLLLLCILALG